MKLIARRIGQVLRVIFYEQRDIEGKRKRTKREIREILEKDNVFRGGKLTEFMKPWKLQHF